jgi:hypothetical protein
MWPSATRPRWVACTGAPTPIRVMSFKMALAPKMPLSRPSLKVPRVAFPNVKKAWRTSTSLFCEIALSVAVCT